MNKQNQSKQNIWKQLLPAGFISGLLNGLFGSGGGIIAVLFFRKMLTDERKVHASATFMILIMSITSFVLYATSGQVPYQTGFAFIPGGLCGAFLGTYLLKKINPSKLRKLFSCILIISGGIILFS